MKRLVLFIFIIILSFVFISCGENDDTHDDDKLEELVINNLVLNIKVNEECFIEYEVLNKKNSEVIFENLNEDIVDLKDNIITGIKEGKANVIAYLSSNPEKKINIIVNVEEEKKPEIIINNFVSEIGLYGEAILDIEKVNSDSEIICEVSDENIIEIKNGIIYGKNLGNATINIYLKDYPEIKYSFDINVIIDPITIFDSLIIDEVLVKEVTTFGENPKTMKQQVLGSVCRYLFDDVKIVTQYAPIDTNEYTGKTATKEMLEVVEPMKLVRPGILLEELKYIVYHDTGNASSGADAKMHANYMVSSDNRNNRARSWHYTVDENGIYYHIPDNEITWQGDSYEAYGKSIGIETCVNYGADLYKVWQNAARLMSDLILKYNLSIEDVKQHFDMSGKNCPQTLRYNNLYKYAISLIEGEIIMKTLLKDYEVSFKSLNPEYLDDTGKVFKLPSEYTRLAYEVTFCKDNEKISKIYYSDINGKCPGSIEELKISEEFDKKVVESNLKATKNNEEKIESLVNEYYNYSENIKNIIGTKDLLFNIEEEMLRLFDNNNDLFINEVYIDKSNTTCDIRYSYIELYNKSNKEIDLNGYEIFINDNRFKLNNGVIKGKGYYLISFGSLNINDNVLSGFPIPDNAFDENILFDNYYIALSNNNVIIDSLGINNDKDYEGESFKTADYLFSISRKHDIDTDNNKRDYALNKFTPVNSNGESIDNTNVDKDIFAFDYNVVLLNRELDITDEVIINILVNEYNYFTLEQRKKVKTKELLDRYVMTIEGIKNPSIASLNKAISQIPNRIVNDYKLPAIDGVSYDFVDSEGKKYYNIESGEYLKLSYECKEIKMIAYHGTESKEFVVNFGLAAQNDKIVYNTGTVKPSSGKTSDGYGTYGEQLLKTGFGGVAIRVKGKIFFIGDKCLINLNSNTLNSKITKKELRPLGGENFINNCGIVNGVATEYSGTGALYYNSGDNDLSFDLSDTYGRNNSGIYGYYKVKFSKDVNGEFYVSMVFPDTGSNNSSNNYQVTLKPGEYLWCPHTYETNVDGGTWLISPSTNTSGGVLVLNEKLEIIHYKK